MATKKKVEDSTKPAAVKKTASTKAAAAKTAVKAAKTAKAKEVKSAVPTLEEMVG